ncbi:MAG TPA: chorismate synthase [Clostridia bacterium]|nr:chorismate synthase [Clostridia bacterium]
MMCDKISLKVWGESHGEAIGADIGGIPAGIKIDLDKLQEFCDRRKSVKNVYSTTRGEEDKIIITAGIENGITTGDTIGIKILNKTQRSSDYDELKYTPRPSHADYPAYVKYGGTYDMSGGGKFSGRLTSPVCAAGAIAGQILEQKGITVGAYVAEIAGIKGASYLTDEIGVDEITAVKSKTFPVIGDKNAEAMLEKVAKARSEGDSVGGIVEAVAFDVPIGSGDALFDGLESKISRLVFGIPAVKGIEFGLGFDITRLKGSRANDAYYYDNGIVKTRTNNNGGILGGMATGMPIRFRVAIKPTPSISKEQNTVNLITGENTQIRIKGRHDACIAPRAAVVVEACLALAILDSII